MFQHNNSVPDYPYYNDIPASIGWTDWIIVLLALGLGFAALTIIPHIPWLSMTLDGLLRSVLFGTIPLSAFAWRVGPAWKAIFHGWRRNYLWWGLVFGVINLLFTYVIGTLAMGHMHLADNSVGVGLSDGDIPGGPAMFYLRTGIQLVGEEVFTILPFLFLMWLGVRILGLPRAAAILLAWIGSALSFGAMHLPAYHWNIGQAFLLIGLVRLVLTLAYMTTKSIWSSIIAHVLNDWAMFTLLIAATALGA